MTEFLQDFPHLCESQYVVLCVHCEHLATTETSSFICNQAPIKAEAKASVSKKQRYNHLRTSHHNTASAETLIGLPQFWCLECRSMYKNLQFAYIFFFNIITEVFEDIEPMRQLQIRRSRTRVREKVLIH